MISSVSADTTLIRVRLAQACSDRMAWAEGLEVTIPRAVLAVAGLERAVNARGELRIPAGAPPIDAHVGAELRLRAAFTARPHSSRLPFSYRSVPGGLRRAIARAMGRIQRRRVDRWAAFPMWPIDVSADVLADWASPQDRVDPDYGPRATPVILTHDIDSPEGLRNLIADFLPMEEAHGAHSTSYIVPCAWPLDEPLLREARSRGHALGIHGYDHSNRTPFANTAERQARLDAARRLAERFEMVGYRSPSLLRTPELLADVAVRYRYDSSMPTSGGPFPVPNNGCASARPFRVGDLLELPISLPRDGSLRFLGHTPDEILRLWTTCADIVARARGVVVLLTHCERHFSGNAAMLRAYRCFLEWIRDSPRFAWATPLDVLTRT
jgi:peptidoglycan/xylan/chitin deacetylase (PgdA/CDA1 family)